MNMIELLIVIYIVWYIVKKKNNRNASKSSRRQQATAIPNRPKKDVLEGAGRWKRKASAVPNVPQKLQRNQEERAMEFRTRESRKMCTYEAAYSKGRPARVGKRGDYETVLPTGMGRIRCAYCNADNFVPSGTHEHYHCYFCWEKL